MNNIQKLLFVIAIPIAATGCSSLGMGESKFTCPGGDDGLITKCMDVTEIYELTNESDYREKTHGMKTPVITESETTQYPVVGVLPEPVRQVIPLRTPSKVMRIYISPWESKSGDLNVPGYVYTEIEGRRWMIGQRPVKNINSKVYKPKKTDSAVRK